MHIVQTLVLMVILITILLGFVNEFATYVAYGNPLKNYRLYRDLIEADLPTGHKFNQIYCTRNGYLCTIPFSSIFGCYYFHHNTKGCIRIPRNTSTHKMAAECMKGE